MHLPPEIRARLLRNLLTMAHDHLRDSPPGGYSPESSLHYDFLLIFRRLTVFLYVRNCLAV